MVEVLFYVVVVFLEDYEDVEKWINEFEVEIVISFIVFCCNKGFREVFSGKCFVMLIMFNI